MRRHFRDMLQSSVIPVTGRDDVLWGNSFRNRAERRMFAKRFKQGGAPSAQSLAAANAAAEQAIFKLGQPMSQPLPQSIVVAGNNTAQGTQQQIVMNNVGLNTEVVIEVTGTIAASGNGETLNRTALGLSALFSNITLTDLSSVQRINAPSWGIHLLQSARKRAPFGSAFVTDSIAQMGSNFLTMNGPAAVNAGTGAQNFRIFFVLPLAYNPAAGDYRGAMYTGTTSAQWRVALTFNPNFVAPSNAADATFSCFKSTSAAANAQGVLSNVTVQVYQNYMDQLPKDRSGRPVLPGLSLSYNYLLNSTTINQLAQAADNSVFYQNFRTILSTIAIYDNAGALNLGTDINYLAINVANLTYLRKQDPFYVQLLTRQLLGTDFPPGMYYLDHRDAPIDTNNYGNQSFIINPSLVNAGASLVLFYEMLAIQSQAFASGSMPGG